MPPTVEYSVLDEHPRADVLDEILPVYRTYDWWADRDRETWDRALAETDELVVVRADCDAGWQNWDDSGDAGDVIAAARVLTDYACYAHVYDVIVHADHRGRGVGRTLVEGIAEHPALEGLSPSLLAREGLVEFYESCGFEDPGAIEHPDGDPEPLTWLVAREESDGSKDGDD